MEYKKNQTWIKYVCCVCAGWLLSAGSLAVKASLRKRYSRVGWFYTGAHPPTQTSALTALSFIYCYINRVASLLSRGLQMWVKTLMKANSLIWRLTCDGLFIYSF